MFWFFSDLFTYLTVDVLLIEAGFFFSCGKRYRLLRERVDVLKYF
jgi:hypothetical protein